MKKLKYLFLFIFPFLFYSNVFADTSYDMTTRITSPVNYTECGSGSYTGIELNGATNCWKTKTRYQGTLNRIYFNLPAPTGSTFEPDTAYRLTIKMATDDWRNNFGTVVVSPGSSYTNNFVDTFTFVSMKQVNITFTVPYSGSTTYQYLYVNLPAKSSGHLITGVSNWNLNNVTLTKLTSGSGGGSSTPSGPSTSFDDTAIINSGKENTQDIINNSNSNTEDIINNNNSNTQEIIESNKVCRSYDKDNIVLNGKYLLNDGTVTDNSNFGTTDYISISPSSTVKILSSTSDSVQFCFYEYNRTPISCVNVRNMASDSSITIPEGSYLLRFSIRKSNNLPVALICTNGSTSINNSIDDVNSSINNSNVDSGVGESFFDNFNNNMHGLSSIITIPLSSIQSLSSSQCTPLHFPIPFTDNKYLDVPCMTEIYQQHIPTLLTLIQTCWYGILAYNVLVNIFGIVKGFKDPDSDKIEVMDL